MKKYILPLISFVILSTTGWCQSFSLAGGGGYADASAASGEGDNGVAWYLSGTMSFGFQEGDLGSSFFLGIAGQETAAGSTENFGDLDIFEYMVPFGYAFRWKRSSVILYGEYRNTFFNTSDGEDSDGDFIFTGGGVRIPLGPTGTRLGRAGLRVIYGQGGGGFVVPGTSNVKEEVTVKEFKAAVEYPFSRSWIGRVEYRTSDYDGDGNSPLFDQEIDSLMGIIVLNF